jgi:hypothetical protein
MTCRKLVKRAHDLNLLIPRHRHSVGSGPQGRSHGSRDGPEEISVAEPPSRADPDRDNGSLDG